MKAQISEHIADCRSPLDIIREGNLPMAQAQSLIRQATHVRFDAWRLHFDPIDHPALFWLGILEPLRIGGKFLHVYPTLLDSSGRELITLHTMAKNPEDPCLPGSMGSKLNPIGIFALTPEASEARRTSEGNSKAESLPIMPLTHPARRAALLAAFAAAIDEAGHHYTVPVSAVLAEFICALRDNTVMPQWRVPRLWLKGRRMLSRTALGLCSKTFLAGLLNKDAAFPLGAQGKNSNSGAAAMATLLGYTPPLYSEAEAPLIESSLMELHPELHREAERLNKKPAAPRRRNSSISSPHKLIGNALPA